MTKKKKAEISSVDSRLNSIMPVSKGKAVRTMVWRRFIRGMTTHEILESFHDSACNIPGYADIDHALVADIIRGRINWYLTVGKLTVEQVAGKTGIPASSLRELMNGGDSFKHLPIPEIEKRPRPIRKKTSTGKKKSINDEAADRVVVTIQAILNGEIDSDHTDIVLRGLCRYAYEERLSFADKIQQGIKLIGQVPTDIALLGILDIASE